MKIAISGSTGLIGTALSEFLRARGDDVVALTRSGDGPYVWADPAVVPDLSGVDVVVHLAGDPVASGRWTDAKKLRIRNSRVDRTAALAEALAALAIDPSASAPALISASAVGIYGADAGTAVSTEDSAPGTDFLAEVCVAWEAACGPAVDAGVRVAHPRFGLVLDPGGGALERMLPIFKLGGGGRLGSGTQFMSWVSLPDTVRALALLIDGDHHGPFNITGPTPVTNAVFSKAMGTALGRPAVIPAPAFAIKLAFGKQMATQTVLASQQAEPTRLLRAGFVFEHPTVDAALSAVLS